MNNLNYEFLLVQGRTLSQLNDSIQYFPSNWDEEFPIIQSLGFTGIEWIYDKTSELTNPILTQTGRMKMLNISQQHNVTLENIVFDWFLVHPLLEDDEFSVEEKLKKLIFLIDVSKKCGFKRVIFPLMEKNSLDNNSKKEKFINIFQDNVLEYLDKWKIEFHLETSLSSEKEYELLKKLNSKWVKSCYDMGNSTSYGFDPETSIKTLSSYIGSVHVKDRKLHHGPTMPLGQGDVNFYKVFESLSTMGFCGPITFQVYRNKDSDNISVLKESMNFINNIIIMTTVKANEN
jgi:sugar phosphate isomerase/epimerase